MCVAHGCVIYRLQFDICPISIRKEDCLGNTKGNRQKKAEQQFLHSCHGGKGCPDLQIKSHCFVVFFPNTSGISPDKGTVLDHACSMLSCSPIMTALQKSDITGPRQGFARCSMAPLPPQPADVHVSTLSGIKLKALCRVVHL